MSEDLRGVLAVIPARFASSRFPGKPLALVDGVPMIQRVYDRVCSVLPAPQVIVATEDPSIQAFCRSRNIAVEMTSPSHPTGTDRVAEVAARRPAELYLNVQGDEPMLRGGDVLQVLREKQRRPESVVHAMSPIGEEREYLSRNVPKVVATAEGRVLYLSRAPVPSTKGAAESVRAFRQVCIYAFNGRELEAFLKHGRKGPIEVSEDIEVLRFLELDIPVRAVLVEGGTLAIDTPEDLVRVEALLRHPA
jgi:3-deoxy-manno-octulosonate cytidylyltransferase (CMP-KDO synthetase)